jgi:hypothetical protein
MAPKVAGRGGWKAPQSGRGGSGKGYGKDAKEEEPKAARLYAVDPTHAFAKFSLRSGLDSFGSPFFGDMTPMAYLSQEHMLGNNLAAGSHEMCNRLGFALSMGGSCIQHGAEFVGRYKGKDISKSFGLDGVCEILEASEGKNWVTSMAFLNTKNERDRTEQEVEVHVKRFLRFLKDGQAEKIKIFKRMAIAGSKMYLFAMEALSQLALASEPEKWQDLMQPTKECQPAAVKRWLRGDPEDWGALKEAFVESFMAQQMSKHGRRTGGGDGLSDDDLPRPPKQAGGRRGRDDSEQDDAPRKTARDRGRAAAAASSQKAGLGGREAGGRKRLRGDLDSESEAARADARSSKRPRGKTGRAAASKGDRRSAVVLSALDSNDDDDDDDDEETPVGARATRAIKVASPFKLSTDDEEEEAEEEQPEEDVSTAYGPWNGDHIERCLQRLGAATSASAQTKPPMRLLELAELVAGFPAAALALKGLEGIPQKLGKMKNMPRREKAVQLMTTLHELAAAAAEYQAGLGIERTPPVPAAAALVAAAAGAPSLRVRRLMAVDTMSDEDPIDEIDLHLAETVSQAVQRMFDTLKLEGVVGDYNFRRVERTETDGKTVAKLIPCEGTSLASDAKEITLIRKGG